MHSKAKPPTDAEHRRFDIITREIGCIVCKLQGKPYTPAEVHHLVSGGKRMGHSYTIPLCPYHHRGVGEGEGSTMVTKSAFVCDWGTEMDLLACTDFHVAAFEERTIGGPVATSVITYGADHDR